MLTLTLTIVCLLCAAGVGAPAEPTTPTAAAHNRHGSVSRNELSLGLDRMALGGRADAEASLTGGGQREHTKMKAAHWVVRLCVFDVSEQEYFSFFSFFFEYKLTGYILKCTES